MLTPVRRQPVRRRLIEQRGTTNVDAYNLYLMGRDASINQWIRAGAVIGMGTDSGTPLNFHRDAPWREAKVFVDHEMPAAKVNTALTWTNSRILGKESELGTIEPGKLADITVVKGNPLFDIVALSNIDVVIKDGVPCRDSTRID